MNFELNPQRVGGVTLDAYCTPRFGALAKYNFFFVGRDYTMAKASYTKVSTLKKRKKREKKKKTALAEYELCRMIKIIL